MEIDEDKEDAEEKEDQMPVVDLLSLRTSYRRCFFGFLRVRWLQGNVAQVERGNPNAIQSSSFRPCR